jgi:23S rRNA (guanosine2251-2'-O)-methyltransferase
MGFKARRPAPAPEGAEWLWGRHAVEAALANPRREGLRRLLLAPGREIDEAILRTSSLRREELETQEIARLLPSGAVHQGFALLAEPLEPLSVDDIADPAQGVILMLDQVTDPQNVGTILRSAAAFGARGVVLQERHAPTLSGVLAKAAAGAVETVPVARAVNLSRALERLSELGWRSVGLAGEAQASLHEVLDGSATVLVMGSEGEGMRRLVAEHCDCTAKIALAQGFESLNVAAAAAVALYEAAKLAPQASAIP